MLRLVMRATLIAVVLAVGFVLYLIYQEERTPRWPTQPAATQAGTAQPAPAAPQAPLSPIPSAPNAGAVAPGTTAAPTATAPAAQPAPSATQGADQAQPQPPTDPLSAALQRLRGGPAAPGTATPTPGGQLTVTAPNAGTAAPPSVAAPGTAPVTAPVTAPGSAAATAPAAPAAAPTAGSFPPADQGTAGTPLAPPGDSALGGATPGGLPPPVPLTPPDAGQPAPPGANLPNVTAAGTRWSLSGGNGGMTVSIDLGGGQVVHVVVAPQFGQLDRAGMEDRVNWLRQSILSRWGARSGTYIYRRDGSIFRTQ